MDLIKFKNLKETNDFILAKSKFDINPSLFRKGFKLFDYQIPAVWAISNIRNWLYTDEMGLGKTAVTCAAVASSISDEKIEKVLIVCLATLNSQWKESFDNFTLLKSIIVEGEKQKRHSLYDKILKLNHQIVIMGYNTLLTDYEIISKLHFDKFICDECDYIKSPESQTTKVVNYFAKRIKNNLLITGTPFTGKLEDTFVYVSILSLGSLPYAKLEQEFCKKQKVKTLVYDKSGSGSSRSVKINLIVGYKNVDEYLGLMSKIKFGRSQEKCGIKLPDIEFLQIKVKKSFLFKKFENQILNGEFTDEKERTFQLNSLQQVSYLHRLSHSITRIRPDLEEVDPKFSEILKVLMTKINEQWVIFFKYTYLLDKIHDFLLKKGYTVSRLCGKVTGSSRTSHLSKFKSGENQFMLMSMASFAGADFYNCRNMLKVDLIYNKAKDEQINRRIVRKNSVHPTSFIYQLYFEDSFEEVISEMLDKRKAIMDALDEDLSKKAINLLKQKANLNIRDLKK